MFQADLTELLASIRLRLEADDKTPVRKLDVRDDAKRDTDEREDEPPDEADCLKVGARLKMVFGRPTCLSPKEGDNIVGVPAVKRRKPIQVKPAASAG